jgi:hypothetical protein
MVFSKQKNTHLECSFVWKPRRGTTTVFRENWKPRCGAAISREKRNICSF